MFFFSSILDTNILFIQCYLLEKLSKGGPAIHSVRPPPAEGLYCQSSHYFLTSNPSSHMPRARVRSIWSKPPSGWFKLNINASVTGHKAGGVGLIRDSEEHWVHGFARHIGSTSVLMAELWALRDGIHMAKNLHIHNLIINVDSTKAIKLISSPPNSDRLTQPLVNDCGDTLQVFN